MAQATDLQNEAEARIRFHRSAISLLPHFILACIATIVANNLIDTGIPVRLALFGHNSSIFLRVDVLVALVLFARPIILMKDCRYELGTHHLRANTGLLSLRSEKIEIPFEDIRGVRVKQTIIDRILNVGTIVAWTADAESADITMKGIKDPETKAKLISERLDKTRIKLHEKARSKQSNLESN